MRATLQSGKMTREAVARATTKHWKGLGMKQNDDESLLHDDESNPIKTLFDFMDARAHRDTQGRRPARC